MHNFQNTCEIELNQSTPKFISMNYDGSQLIILRHSFLSYYKRVGKQYQIQSEWNNLIFKWEIYDLMIHPYEKQLGVIYKQDLKLFYTSFRFSEKNKKWKLQFNKRLLDIDEYVDFPLNFNLKLNPSLNLINTNYNQPLLEELMGVFQLQVRQHAKILRKYQIQGENIKYFDKKQLILSVCQKKLLIYKYYHFQPLQVYNTKCNIFDVTFNDEGQIFIFCTRGLIIQNLDRQIKQQIIQLDPLIKKINSQIELQCLQGVIIFSTTNQTYYYLNLQENDQYQAIKNKKKYTKFISNAKGNIYLILEYFYSKRKSNKLKVFELL